MLKQKNRERKWCIVRGSQIWLWDMQLRTGCSHRHEIPSNMYHETLPIRSELHCWFIKIQSYTQTSTSKWNLLKNGSLWLKQHEVLSCLLYSPPKFLTQFSYGKSNEKISRFQAENLEMQQIIYLKKNEYPWEIWKDHQIIKVTHDWKTISDCVN